MLMIFPLSPPKLSLEFLRNLISFLFLKTHFLFYYSRMKAPSLSKEYSNLNANIFEEFCVRLLIPTNQELLPHDKQLNQQMPCSSNSFSQSIISPRGSNDN